MNWIEGGITAPKGFRASGVHAGVKSSNSDKKDLALIVSDCEAAAAAVYTRNRVKAAPIYVTMAHLEDGAATAVVVNSGNANACAPGGAEHASAMCASAAKATGLKASDFIVASTGVIGQELNIAAIEAAMPACAAALSATGSDAAATAIMTTDTKKKELAVEFTVGGKTCRIGAISKGSGMIHPNMGTTLSFVTTDCAITPALLHEALTACVNVSLNRVSIDGDTSTNDMCCVLANGMAENALIDWKNEDYDAFCAALRQLLIEVARSIAADGEGASRLITSHVVGARSEETAERLAKEIICSSLVKAAMFGADANWGRVLCAMGYSKAPFRPEFVDVSFRSCAGEIAVCAAGAGLPFDEALAKQILSQDEIIIEVNVHEGEHACTCWGCDLTYDYVKINGDYRT
ncbi:MAG: bifunctional glutamate N-acetyltransferase/amino-acid acetyltransferase ArgJ [Oscillospiraceae bacterium]|nr:bifunctional glutamate N-acetyltransferase/amino-acid acetyltransferase ArgJ [Oscillospiraceae bacterium]